MSRYGVAEAASSARRPLSIRSPSWNMSPEYETGMACAGGTASRASAASSAAAAAVADIHQGWLEDWRFLSSAEPMRSQDFEAGFSGLKLPRQVVDKIYRGNAEALFPGGWARSAR